jgi:hypothetical protein
MSPRVRALLLAVLLAACQSPPPVYHVEQARSYAKARPVVWDEILVVLERQRIVPTRSDPGAGTLEAERHAFEDMGWADCERARVTDSNGHRPTRARPVARDLSLRITLQEAGAATEVRLEARFTEQQINPYRNLPFTQACRSKGVLERALLDAL